MVLGLLADCLLFALEWVIIPAFDWWHDDALPALKRLDDRLTAGIDAAVQQAEERFLGGQ